MIKLEIFKFTLYIAGDERNSVEAIDNLTAICRSYLAGRHQIEIIDVLQEPARALEDGIYLTPTLFKVSPRPLRQIIGTLSQTQTVLQALGLQLNDK
jgi:circadian clock protein KaiB